MDYIRKFDIRLEKEMYYPGESLLGHVILHTVENFKLKGKYFFFFFFFFITIFQYLYKHLFKNTAIRVIMRGKAEAEWKVIVSGDRRTVKDEQTFIDDRNIIWGKGFIFVF